MLPFKRVNVHGIARAYDAAQPRASHKNQKACGGGCGCHDCGPAHTRGVAATSRGVPVASRSKPRSARRSADADIFSSRRGLAAKFPAARAAADLLPAPSLRTASQRGGSLWTRFPPVVFGKVGIRPIDGGFACALSPTEWDCLMTARNTANDTVYGSMGVGGQFLDSGGHPQFSCGDGTGGAAASWYELTGKGLWLSVFQTEVMANCPHVWARFHAGRGILGAGEALGVVNWLADGTVGSRQLPCAQDGALSSYTEREAYGVQEVPRTYYASRPCPVMLTPAMVTGLEPPPRDCRARGCRLRFDRWTDEVHSILLDAMADFNIDAERDGTRPDEDASEAAIMDWNARFASMVFGVIAMICLDGRCSLTSTEINAFLETTTRLLDPDGVLTDIPGRRFGNSAGSRSRLHHAWCDCSARDGLRSP
jgi:hypothetical protein